MMSTSEKKVEEFCINGNLKPYRPTLTTIFKMIEEANCNISARYDGGPSVHEFRNGRDHCLIRIAINQFKDTTPIRTIWTILHEFGHHNSETIQQKDYTDAIVLTREKEAWDYARTQVLRLSQLAGKVDDFEVYAKECLESYLRKTNNSTL